MRLIIKCDMHSRLEAKTNNLCDFLLRKSAGDQTVGGFARIYDFVVTRYISIDECVGLLLVVEPEQSGTCTSVSHLQSLKRPSTFLS